MDIRDLSTDEEVYILEYWYVLARRKKLIALITVVGLLVSIVISLLLPVSYSATTSILPQKMSIPISLLGSDMPGGLDVFLCGSLETKEQAATWVGILKSNNVKDGIIESFGLKDVYGVETLEKARRALGSHLAIVKSRKDSIISVTLEDTSPERAADLANAFIEELNRVNRALMMNARQKMMLFFKKRLVETKGNLTNAENLLMRFQEDNKAVKLDAQSVAIIESIGAIKGELMAREVELSTLLSYATPENLQVQILKAQIDGLKSLLKKFESNKSPVDYIPNSYFEYARLLRELKVQQTLYDLRKQHYEIVRIQESDDSCTVQVLDAARVPQNKSKPKRSLIVVTSTFMALFLSILFSFVLEFINKAKQINRGGS